MANALNEMLGGSVDATIASGDYRCRLDSGEGACRLYVVRPQTAGCTFTLPNPAYIRPGAAPNFTVINKGPEAIVIRSFGTASIYSLAVNRAVDIRIAAQGVDFWILQGPFVVSTGTALNGNRIPMVVNYTASSTKTTVLDRDVAQQYGYVRSQGPVAIQCTIKANVVLGSSTTADAAFFTGAYPAGSTLLLVMEPGSYITGAGGTGGTGETAAGGSATAGSNGGFGLAVYCNTVVVSQGTIQGGGGGGGGSRRLFVGSQFVAGGSGGGGGGAQPGIGGSRVDNIAGTEGSIGTLVAGGVGGFANTGWGGGYGGSPGFAGVNGQPAGSGALAGQAGPAIGVRASFTLTTLGTGTVLGSTVSI